MKTKIFILALLISLICSAAYAGECTIRLRTLTQTNVSFTLYDSENQWAPIDNGILVAGTGWMTRTLRLASNELRLEYRVSVGAPTGKRPKLKVHEIPCGADVTINK